MNTTFVPDLYKYFGDIIHFSAHNNFALGNTRFAVFIQYFKFILIKSKFGVQFGI